METESSFADNYSLRIAVPSFKYLESTWRNWRIWAIDHHVENGMVRLNVFAEPADSDVARLEQSFHFMLDKEGCKASERFIAFCVACGIRDEISNTRELLGRFFSMRNDGKYAIDFMPFKPRKVVA